jgi:hypothetical protein
VCVCISESGRNKTQLAGKEDSLRGGNKHSPSWRVSLKKLVANFKFYSHLASWRVVISTPGVYNVCVHPCICVYAQGKSQLYCHVCTRDWPSGLTLKVGGFKANYLTWLCPPSLACWGAITDSSQGARQTTATASTCIIDPHQQKRPRWRHTAVPVSRLHPQFLF